MFDFSTPFRSLLGSIPSSFHAFVLPIYLSICLFIDASLYPWFLLEYECSLSSGMFVAVLFHSALLLYFIFSSIRSFIAWRLQSWPGGLREAIKSAVPEGASGVLNNFIKSFAKSFANPAGLFGLFLSKKLF